MTDSLRTIDQQLFFFVNQSLQNDFFDWLMPLLRNRFFWIPLYVFIAAYLIINYKRQSPWIIGLLLITFAISDYSSSSIIKPFFERLRPCRDPETASYVRLLVPCGGGYSFVSTHAANHFAIALFLIKFFYDQFRWVLPAVLLWAFSICFAQVYVGLHFPFDILGGAVWGALIGFVTGHFALRYKTIRHL